MTFSLEPSLDNRRVVPAIDGGGSMINMARVRAGRTNFLSNIPPPAFHFKWGVGQESKAPEGKMWDELEFLLGARTSETTSSCSPPPVRANDQYIGWWNGRCLGVLHSKTKMLPFNNSCSSANVFYESPFNIVR